MLLQHLLHLLLLQHLLLKQGQLRVKHP